VRAGSFCRSEPWLAPVSGAVAGACLPGLCRAQGRHRLYRLESARLRPVQDWLAKYTQAINDRLDRMDDYLRQLQREGAQR
jgi:hypothetical protein